MPAPACRRLAGFTLIELLIVILIIGILVAIGVPAYLRYTAAANDRSAQTALQVAYKAAVAGDTEVNSGRFPVASTVVNDIKADEPAASVAPGDCAGTVVQAPVKQVLVDPSSTSTSLTICTRSASGTIWKLSGPLTGTPTLVDGSKVALTGFTGNEINDAVRAAAVQGDGLSNDSSTGLWEGTTNLLKDGGCEGTGTPSNMGPWGGTNNETRAKDSSQHKFGSNSCAVGTDGSVAGQGLSWHDDTNLPTGRIGVLPGTVYTLSVWLRGSVGGETVKLGLNSYDSGGSNLSNVGSSTDTLTTSWQRFVFTTTTPANTAAIWPWVDTASAQADTFYLDGAQLEAKSEATPYVETNGTTASRALPQIQAPASLLSPTQGWVAVRMRLGFSNTDVMNPTSMAVFDIGSNNNNEILGYWDPNNHVWALGRDQGAPSSPGRPGAGDTFTPGALRTLIFRWTSSLLAVSVNGAAFVANGGANTAAPILDSNLYIGSRSWGSFDQAPDSDILWLATGTGTLSDADAATINGFGNSDPSRAVFPSTAQATMAWDGSSSTGSLK